MYWGLIVSNMINFILPWRFNITGGSRNFSSKVTLAIQQLVLLVLAFLIVSNCLMELISSKKAGKKHFYKVSLRNWWCSYENFIYPLLVINDSPYYFLAIIGVSQLVYFLNSLTVPKLKALAILKALYPIGFHICFVIFQTVEDDIILSYATIGCLSIFLIGSCHYLIESVVKAFRSIHKTLKDLCSA